MWLNEDWIHCEGEFRYLAPFSQVSNTYTNKIDTFFAYGSANSDQLPHFKVLGNNLFGLEDMHGGGDHDNDDLIIGFKFDPVSIG